jgi:two-component system, OmpR family, sensor kinase
VSIRLRLTLWYGVTFALLIAIAGVAVWWQFEASLRRSMEDSLRIHAEDIESQLTEDGDPMMSLEPPRPGVFAVLMGPGNKIVDAGPGAPTDLPPLPTGASVRSLQAGGPAYAFYAIRLADGRLLITGSSLSEVDRSADRLAELLMVSAGGCAVASLVGGWWLAGRALRPIRVLNQGAESIGPADLARRLPISDPDDEIGRLTATLNHLLARIEEGVARERSFLNGAAHDLRTPIAALRMQLDLLLRGDPGPGSSRDALEDARRDAIALGELADGLLGLADAQSAGPHDGEAETVLPMLVARSEQEVERLASQRRVRIETRVDESSVRLSPVRFHQALTNLLSNAIRHGPEGQTVTVVARVERPSPGQHPSAGHARVVLVEVADAGPGIDPHLRDDLFVPFAMSRRATTAHGLGLATAAAAVHSQGGEIGYRDRVGGGSVFWFRLPVS